MLDRVHADWAALEDLIAPLSDAEWTTSGPEVWSVKDHLAHIAEWERACAAVLDRRPQYEGFALDPSRYAELELDPLNEVLYQRNRDLSIGDVKDMARRAHADIIALLSRLSDADVGKSIAEYGADATDNRPLLAKIAGDTYGHYAEHVPWIRELLAAIRR